MASNDNDIIRAVEEVRTNFTFEYELLEADTRTPFGSFMKTLAFRKDGDAETNSRAIWMCVALSNQNNGRYVTFKR